MARKPFHCKTTGELCARPACSVRHCAAEAGSAARQNAQESEKDRRRLVSEVRAALAPLSPEERKRVIANLEPEKRDRLKGLFPDGF